MTSHDHAALVTGAAQGIGYAISERLLQEGYRVCLADVNKEKGKESLCELQKKYGVARVAYVDCDVTSKASFEESFTRTQEIFGKIDLLVNNAGITDEFDPQRTVAINLMGTIIGCQLAFKYMGTSNGGKGGVVVNVASVAGLIPSAIIPVYDATKHGIVGLTRSYGEKPHFDKNGIIFMAVCPYFVETALLKTAKTLKFTEENVISDASQLAVELGVSIISPEFVAEGVSKLLKDKVNGSTLVVMPEKLFYVGIPDELKNIIL